MVVDEAHTYTGVFGSHVALALRRLHRIYERVYRGVRPIPTRRQACLVPLGVRLSTVLLAMNSRWGWVCSQQPQKSPYDPKAVQWILSTATIANPAELALALTGQPATVVERSGAPQVRFIGLLINQARQTYWIGSFFQFCMPYTEYTRRSSGLGWVSLGVVQRCKSCES